MRPAIPEITNYLKAADSYPVVGITVNNDGSFDAWQAERECLIAGVIVNAVSDDVIAHAKVLAKTKELELQHNGMTDYVIPCVIAPKTRETIRMTASLPQPAPDDDDFVIVHLVDADGFYRETVVS